MFKQFLSSLFAALLTLVACSANAQAVTDEAICRAAGIGAGNISDYKTRYFDQDPIETMWVIAYAKNRLPAQPSYLREKVNMTVVNAATPKSWPTVQAALNEFGKLCPCGGQSPCSSGPLKMIEKVN